MAKAAKQTEDVTVQKQSEVILVGYKTSAIEDVRRFMPVFKGRTGTNDPAKIAAQIQEKEEDWLAQSGSMPYTSQLSEVCIMLPSFGKLMTFNAEERKSAGKMPICRSIKNFLLKHYKQTWSNDIFNRPSDQRVMFIGFDPKHFLKLLGIECSLPSVRDPLPLSMWYGNTDHRDITEMVLPKDYANLSWETLLKVRREGLSEEELKQYDEHVAGWTKPGDNPTQDVLITMSLCLQLGVITNVTTSSDSDS